MYDFFGGVAKRLVCDNLKAAVTSHPKEGEIVLTADYEAMGMHYVAAIMPTGVRKPKQKASVEGTCGKIATSIIAKLRNQTFTSLHEVNTAITRALYEFNNKDFTKREGSRYEAYLDEKLYLHPLPDSGERFQKYFKDYIAKYGFRDMYSGGFYPFETLEENWAYWSRYIYINRYMDSPKPIYNNLLELMQNKDYFVLTTNVDHCFQKAGFSKSRIFYTRGILDYFSAASHVMTRHMTMRK